MKAIIFIGPTISAAEARAELDAEYRPPAAQGDVYLAALAKPAAIGIIDGYFERVPSVSHKEILWAMKEGIHDFGASSMGALRAAELAQFGMEGVGDVFAAFERGELDADDEVAVAHALAEDGYRPLSTAMVDIRATLAGAAAERAIREETRATLVGIAKSLFYADRSYPMLLLKAKEAGLPESEIASLEGYLPERRVERKKLDALALLRVLRERLTSGITPRTVRYHFQHTDAWEHIVKKTLAQAGSADGSVHNKAVGDILGEPRDIL
jgi:hypothetical protein